MCNNATYAAYGVFILPHSNLQTLNDLMEQNALNVKKVADCAEVTVSCVYMWLREERNIPRYRLNMIRHKLTPRTGAQMALGDVWNR